MRRRGRKFSISREGHDSGYQAMVEHIVDDGYREVAVSFHCGGQCVADIYITVDPDTLQPVVYVTADGEGDDDHKIVVHPLKPKEDAVKFE